MGGCEDERTINWVKWEAVCKPIENGDLGIRNLMMFNYASLGKWEWKVINERKGIWFEALVNTYGMVNGSLNLGLNGASIWWKDICSLDIGGG